MFRSIAKQPGESVESVHGVTCNMVSITHCYLPPSRDVMPALTTAEASIRFSDPGGMQS